MKPITTIIDEPNNVNIDVGDVVTVVEKDHRRLNNLDFENSGHTGFASLQDLENIKKQIRVNSFTYNTLSELGAAFGIDVSQVKDEYSVTKSTIIYRGKASALSNGDTFYIVQVDVPDYWFSLDDMKLYKQETELDFSSFATIDDIKTAIGNVSSLLGNTDDLEV